MPIDVPPFTGGYLRCEQSTFTISRETGASRGTIANSRETRDICEANSPASF
jgi:hypothetical protein